MVAFSTKPNEPNRQNYSPRPHQPEDPFKDANLPSSPNEETTGVATPSQTQSPYHLDPDPTTGSCDSSYSLNNPNSKLYFNQVITIPPGDIKAIQSALNDSPNHRIKIVITKDFPGNSIDIKGLNLPKGGILAFQTEDGKMCNINFEGCDLQGNIQSLSESKIATTFVGADFSKTNKPTSKLLGKIFNVKKACHTDAKGVHFVGGIGDVFADSLAGKVARIPLLGWILNNTPSCWELNPFSKKTQIIENFEGMVFDKTTKFYPSEEQCCDKFKGEAGFADLNEIKIIQEMVNIKKRGDRIPSPDGELKLNELLDELEGEIKSIGDTSDTLKNFSSMLADKLGIDAGTVSGFLTQKILKENRYQDKFKEYKTNLETYNQLTSKYKEKVNKQVHALLNHYSGKVTVDPKMNFAELHDYLQSDNTFAKINDIDPKTLDPKYDKFKNKANDPIYKVTDFDTGRKFLVSVDKDGKLIAMLEENAGNDNKLKEGKIFKFKTPAEFLQKYIIENTGMTKEWQEKNGNGHANVVKGYNPKP